jgi:hypothetical protein
MAGDSEAPRDDVEAALVNKYMESVANFFQVQAEPAIKIIEAVREYLAALPGEDANPGPARKPASEERALLAYGKLIDRSRALTELGPLAQLQSLNMLAVVVRRLSDESGRSVTEILDQLRTGFTDFSDTQSLIQRVVRYPRDE